MTMAARPGGQERVRRTGDRIIMSGFFEGAMLPSDREANAQAIFYPAREPGQPLITFPPGRDGEGISDETYGPPCMEVAGVQVYAYVRDGILVVSLHYDTADTSDSTPFAVYDGNCIPTVIKAGDADPVWTALPADAITEADRQQLRKTGEDQPSDWVLPGWAQDYDY